MPIYEYVCMSCESHFEELVRSTTRPGLPGLRVDEGEEAVLGVRSARHQPAAQLRRRLRGRRLLRRELWLRRH